MTENVVLATIECNKEYFYIYWLNNEFDLDKIDGCYAIIKGNLTNLLVKNYNGTPKKITAVCVKGMEKYDF